MVEVAATSSDLTYQLQRERTAAASFLTSKESEAGLQRYSKATDRSIAKYREQRDRLDSVPSATESSLQSIDRGLDNLASLRAQVLSGRTPLSSMAFGYRILIADLIAYREGIAQAEGVETEVADQIHGAASLVEASEHLGQQQVIVIRGIADGGLAPAARRAFDATSLGYTNAVEAIDTRGFTKWRTWMDESLSGTKELQAQGLEDDVERSSNDSKLPVSHGEWRKATSDRLSLLHSVQKRVDDDVLNTVDDRRTTLIWWAVIELTLVLVTLIGTVVVANRLGRSMIRQLRRLRNTAHEVAHERLPDVVSTLSEPGAMSGSSPEEIAKGAGNPVETEGRDDEIAEVGEAFNSVHHAAVRLAAEQAVSHERFAETLVGVARRGAQLTRVMTSELNSVQREELDPERMQVLFALDHLAIRMDRNAKSLLVLGGYGQGRVRTTGAPCTSVIYAGAQQIEQYERVSLGHVEPSLGIAARVVDDLAHLLAELMDNATRYSPPGKEIGVAAWRLWDRAVVQIVDEGVGIPPDKRAELNAELATPQADVGAVRSMGLQVVARLAARHDMTVELRASEGPGTIAEVSLPPTAVIDVSEGDVPESFAGASAATASPARPPRTEPGPVPAPRAPVAPPVRETPQDRVPRPAPPAPVPPPAPAPVRQREHRPSGDIASPPSSSVPSPAPAPEHREQLAGNEGTSRVAGVSKAGLPVRRRPGTEGGGESGAHGPSPASTSRPPARPKKAPAHRDSRQVSDVLAAYAQGINRSHRNRAGSADSSRNPKTSSASNDDS
ncbi:nitrate- and nitrite sensing domain-containing protein [Streptomyces sp. NPDC005438]|uniref:sensor histidine kinase n=1 Tax=Streptomyces sp. NPDC005438 TaxID=3156880 RepID=UPI0033AE07AA